MALSLPTPGTKEDTSLLLEATWKNCSNHLAASPLLGRNFQNIRNIFLPHRSPGQILPGGGQGPYSSRGLHLHFTGLSERGGNLRPCEEHHEKEAGPGPLPVPMSPQPGHQGERRPREERKTTLLGMDPVIYACCTDNIRQEKKKSFVLFFHICWLLFTYPANALALESFLQYAGERGGRE